MSNLEVVAEASDLERNMQEHLNTSFLKIFRIL